MLEAVCELSRRWEIPTTSAQEGKGPVGSGMVSAVKLLPHLHMSAHLPALMLIVSCTSSQWYSFRLLDLAS